jgi:N-6 DNA Methylase/Alcohol dehydrogenase GroES-like domain
VVKLLVEMLKPYQGRVYDPCCGSSGMFVQSVEFIRAHAVGPHVTKFQPGDHVIACLSFFCGKCDYCLVGRTNLCSDKPNRGPDAPPRLSKNGRPLTQAAGIGA